MGSSKSEMVEVISKTVARKWYCLFDAAKARAIDANANADESTANESTANANANESTMILFASQNIKTMILRTAIE